MEVFFLLQMSLQSIFSCPTPILFVTLLSSNALAGMGTLQILREKTDPKQSTKALLGG